MPILHLWETALSTLVIHAHAGIVCPVGDLPCPTAISFTAHVGRIASGIAGSALGIIAAMLIFYSLKLIVSGQDESHVTEVRNAYFHIIFGAVLVAGASAILAVVTTTPGEADPALLNANVLNPLRNFFFTMTAAALTINIGYHGARLIVVQDESAAGTARQGIIKGVIGLSAVLLAGIMVDAFNVASTFDINAELTGIGRFLILLFAVLAVVCIVVAGFFLVISADEQLKDRSKKIIITTAVALIIVMASAIILSVFF